MNTFQYINIQRFAEKYPTKSALETVMMSLSEWVVEELYLLHQVGILDVYFRRFQAWSKFAHSDFSEAFYTSLFVNGLVPQVRNYVKSLYPCNVIDAYDLACICEFESRTKFKDGMGDSSVANDDIVVPMLDDVHEPIPDAASAIKHSSHSSRLNVDIVRSKESIGASVPAHFDDPDTYLLVSIPRGFPNVIFDNVATVIAISIRTARIITKHLHTSRSVKDGYVSISRTWVSDIRDDMQLQNCYSRAITPSSRCFTRELHFSKCYPVQQIVLQPLLRMGFQYGRIECY